MSQEEAGLRRSNPDQDQSIPAAVYQGCEKGSEEAFFNGDQVSGCLRREMEDNFLVSIESEWEYYSKDPMKLHLIFLS
jgi:hypothetical protein